MDRKEFFSKALIGGGLLFFAPALLNSCSKSGDSQPGSPGGSAGSTTIDLNSNDFAALNTIGGFAYSGNIIIIRTGTSSYAALSSICTHQSCTVAYSSSDDKIKCPCHGSIYSINGTVLQGPAPNALKVYTVKIEGNTLKIS